MSNARSPLGGSEPFWSRVRQALGTARSPAADGAERAELAQAIGLGPRLNSRIEEELAQAWMQAAARRVSLSLLIVEIDRVDDYCTAYGAEALGDVTGRVEAAILAHRVRQTDACLRMGRAGFVLAMPDMPGLMARAMAGRIDKGVRELNLSHKESHLGTITVSAGLVVGNPRGAYDPDFLATAIEAVGKAQRKGLARLEAVDLRPTQEGQRRAA